MRSKQFFIAILVVLAVAGTLAAQEKEELPQVEVYGGYALLHSEGANLNGWKTGVGFTLNRWAAIAVEGDGYYRSELTSSGTQKESEYSLTAGPHFSLRNKSKLVPFAYALAGGVWESSSIAGEKESRSGFAFETGGGLE